MGTSNATARWTGSFKKGKGMMHPAHATEIPFTAGSRFEGEPASNPEELLGAALAGCFSMALSVALGKAGHEPDRIDTRAAAKLERVGDGFAITSIDLTTEAVVPNLEQAAFDEIAQETKKGCPVSKALAGTTINLTATLKA